MPERQSFPAPLHLIAGSTLRAEICDLANQSRSSATTAPILEQSKCASFTSKTHLLTAMVVLTNVVGNVCLSHGMQEVGRTLSASPADYVRALLNPWVLAGSCTLALWMISDLALLSRADLAFRPPRHCERLRFYSDCGPFRFRGPDFMGTLARHCRHHPCSNSG